MASKPAAGCLLCGHDEKLRCKVENPLNNKKHRIQELLHKYFDFEPNVTGVLCNKCFLKVKSVERKVSVMKNTQCCLRLGLPAQLGYFEIAWRRSKNFLAGGLKPGYFSSVHPRQLSFLQMHQFPVNSERFWALSMSHNILFINFRD